MSPFTYQTSQFGTNFNQYPMVSSPFNLQESIQQSSGTTEPVWKSKTPRATYVRALERREEYEEDSEESETGTVTSAVISKEQCMDPAVFKKIPAAWYRGQCHIGCGSEKSMLDPVCVAAKKEKDLIDSCLSKNGSWKEAQKEGSNWKEGWCEPEEALSTERGDCPMSEAETGYKFKYKCGIMTEKVCLDPKFNNGNAAATWYHGSCWAAGCDKDEKKADPFCIASKNEADNILACTDKKGVWTEARRDGPKSWKEGWCDDKTMPKETKIKDQDTTVNDQGSKTNDQGTIINEQGSKDTVKMRLYLTAETSYLKSEKDLSSTIPSYDYINECVNNLSLFQNKNLQISDDHEQILFRDNKKINGIFQSGVSIIEEGVTYFVEENHLIKIRNESCKIEREQYRNLKRKTSCSVSFMIGDKAYTAKFINNNLIEDVPEYLITYNGVADYGSSYTARSYGKKVNYKSLYLGIESSIKNLTNEIKKDCKLFANDVSADEVSSIATCERVLNNAWANDNKDLGILDDLRNASRLCIERKKKPKINNYVDETPAPNISK